MRMIVRTALVAPLVVSAPLALGGCSAAPPQAPTTPATPTTTLTVAAAASLTRTFTALRPAYERSHPGTTLSFTFAGSSDLAARIDAGEPVDVFVAADPESTRPAADHLEAPTWIATNRLVVLLSPKAPDWTTFAQVTRGTVSVCAPQVPCGRQAIALEQEAGVTLTPASEEPSVSAVVERVRSGQADAGLVYATDARANPTLRTIRPPQTDEIAPNRYPAAVVRESPHAEQARAFVTWLTTPEAQDALRRAGFGPA